jgi:hypothetical protein
VPIKGIASPLKLKIEYLETKTKFPMSKNMITQLKGSINMYLSRDNQNPQPNTPDGKKLNERSYHLVMPPKSIAWSSNDQNVPGVPFQQDYLYLSIDCKELDLLDDTTLEILGSATEGNMILSKQKKSGARARAANKNASLDDYEDIQAKNERKQ